MHNPALFRPYQSKAFDLTHRIILAPMTRIRSKESNFSPNELTSEYYQQRATQGGLLITEAIHISPEATPIWSIYPSVERLGGQVPGIWSDEQMLAWRSVCNAAHKKGGLISCQLLHTGRVAQPEIEQHPAIINQGFPLPPVSSSAVRIPRSNEEGNHYNWDKGSTIPRELSLEDIQRVCKDYQHAASNALKAGFDYIELHAAHGYLVDQFLCDSVNQRNDRYGGSVSNRCRFLSEVIESLLDIVGPMKLGVRLSPTTINEKTGETYQSYFGATCNDPKETYLYAVDMLNRFPLAYLLLTEPRVSGLALSPENETAYRHPLSNQSYREIYNGTLIGAGGFTPHTAADAISENAYDLIAFGRWFLSNPDLPERIRHGHDLNIYDRETFYGGKSEGYTDYPSWSPITHTNFIKYPLIQQSKLRASLKDTA